MKRFILTLGSATIATAPMLTVACSAEDTEEKEEVIVFDLSTLNGVEEVYDTFIDSESSGAPTANYAFKIGDDSLINEWTTAEINSVKNAGADPSFDLTDMDLEDASEIIEEAFNNMPRLEEWDDFVGDAKDGVINKYLYYAADEVDADVDNKNGEWGDYNVKGHDLYTNAEDLIESAFGTLPSNIDLYHVERGGDSAKNLYFKLIDRDTNEILTDSFKVDIKWGSTQEEIDKFGSGFFSSMIDHGKQIFGSTKALFEEIVNKNDYADIRSFIESALEYIFFRIADAIWGKIKPSLAPFSYMPGASLLYHSIMDIPISKGEAIVMDFLDSKFAS